VSMDSTDNGLLTPDNCVIIFIDHQPQLFLGTASIDGQALLYNLLLLAKAAKIFRLSAILTAIESKEFKAAPIPELLELFPRETHIERSTMNSWDSREFVAAAALKSHCVSCGLGVEYPVSDMRKATASPQAAGSRHEFQGIEP
jgi:nicotinamidase-related amidase